MNKFFCSILLIIISLSVLNASPLRERVYMQTDKHLYLAGESVLIKVATLDQGQIPLTLSKIAYVELVGDSIARLQIMIELTNGTGSGQMQLPANLTAGYYRLIAYTQYMRNEGTNTFFEKNIAVLNTFISGFQPAKDEATPDLLASPPALSVGEETNMVSLQTDKAIYTTRDRGQLIISGLTDNIHTLSVSVAGKDLIPVDESARSLFQKNKMIKPVMFTDEFLPEYEGHIISGKIIDNQSEQPINNDISVVSGVSFPGAGGIRFFSGQRIDTDNVRFFTSGISGTKEITTAVFLHDEKYRIEVLSPFVTRYAQKQMPQLHIDSIYYEQTLDRSVALQAFRYISDEQSATQNTSDPFFNIKPSQSYLLDAYTRFPTMQEIFIEFIIGARFRRNSDGKQELSVLVFEGRDIYRYGTNPLVLLDGVPVIDHDVIFNYDPLTVERINIYYGSVVLNDTYFNGIVELTTYRRLYQGLILNKATHIYPYEGPQLPFRMETPDYSKEKNRESWLPDSRHTLLWNPDVRPNGKTSIHLSFDTSDLSGEFQATVEGITKDGQLVSETIDFIVVSYK